MHRYCLMLECWQHNPNKRPSFPSLTEILGKMVSDQTPYLTLGEEYDNYDRQLREYKRKLAGRMPGYMRAGIVPYGETVNEEDEEEGGRTAGAEALLHKDDEKRMGGQEGSPQSCQSQRSSETLAAAEAGTAQDCDLNSYLQPTNHHGSVVLIEPKR